MSIAQITPEDYEQIMRGAGYTYQPSCLESQFRAVVSCTYRQTDDGISILGKFEPLKKDENQAYGTLFEQFPDTLGYSNRFMVFDFDEGLSTCPLFEDDQTSFTPN